jgi:2-polyprenyl-6-methoxyphenol hydroxylase-like FAD-dependent oxidoreductase
MTDTEQSRLPAHETASAFTATPRIGAHAVVLGASISGLLSARVLSDAYDHVTLVERDELPETLTGDRRGVPQGRHAHGLLPRGAQILEDLFPGLLKDFVSTGVSVVREPDELYFSLSGHLLCQQGQYTDLTGTYQPSRPHLEGHIRARVRALPNVKVLDGRQVAGLETSPGNDRVTGARLADGETLNAELVVDATGRSGRAVRWLAAMGYEQPAEEQLPVDIMYVSQFLRPVSGAMGREKAVIIGHAPWRPTGAEFLEQENGRWLLTLIGYRGHHPPTVSQGFVEFARSIVPPHVFNAISNAEPLTDIVAHRFPASVRRRYEQLTRFPDGFVVIGDAICSFNPIYAQGMSVSALQAVALRKALAGGRADLARRFFKTAARPIGIAWQMAVGGDLALPQVEGPRPLPVKVINAYLNRVLAAAERDMVLTERFVKVQSLLTPPAALLGPATVCRVLAGSLRRRRRR